MGVYRNSGPFKWKVTGMSCELLQGVIYLQLNFWIPVLQNIRDTGSLTAHFVGGRKKDFRVKNTCDNCCLFCLDYHDGLCFGPE